MTLLYRYTYLYIKKLKIKNYISSSNKCISCAFSIQQCVLLENKPSVSPTLTGGLSPRKMLVCHPYTKLFKR